MTADRDDLPAIRQMLVGHQIESINMSHVDCTCGWTNEPTPKPGEAALFRDFLKHVAQMVLESDWLRGVKAEARAQELRDAAKEIYNGAPDPCQAFYNYGLHPWLMDRADRVDAEDTDTGTHSWKATGRDPWTCQKCGTTEPRDNETPDMNGCV